LGGDQARAKLFKAALPQSRAKLFGTKKKAAHPCKLTQQKPLKKDWLEDYPPFQMVSFQRLLLLNFRALLFLIIVFQQSLFGFHVVQLQGGCDVFYPPTTCPGFTIFPDLWGNCGGFLRDCHPGNPGPISGTLTNKKWSGLVDFFTYSIHVWYKYPAFGWFLWSM